MRALDETSVLGKALSVIAQDRASLASPQSVASRLLRAAYQFFGRHDHDTSASSSVFAYGLRPILEAMRDLTYREIAEEFTNRGIKTPRGGNVWNEVTIMRAC